MGQLTCWLLVVIVTLQEWRRYLLLLLAQTKPKVSYSCRASSKLQLIDDHALVPLADELRHRVQSHWYIAVLFLEVINFWQAAALSQFKSLEQT